VPDKSDAKMPIPIRYQHFSAKRSMLHPALSRRDQNALSQTESAALKIKLFRQIQENRGHFCLSGKASENQNSEKKDS